MCITVYYWADNQLVFVGNSKCGSAGGAVYSYWNDPGYFPAGTVLCNT
jgi:hypothetical protein